MCNNHFSYNLHFQLLLTFSGTKSDLTNFALFFLYKKSNVLSYWPALEKKSATAVKEAICLQSIRPWAFQSEPFGCTLKPLLNMQKCGTSLGWMKKKYKSPNRWKITLIQGGGWKRYCWKMCLFFSTLPVDKHVMQLSRAFLISKVENCFVAEPWAATYLETLQIHCWSDVLYISLILFR